MLGNLRGQELLIILLILVLLFGAKKLPETARGLGRSLRIFKAETKGLAEDEAPVAAPLPPAAPPVAQVPPIAPAPVQGPPTPTVDSRAADSPTVDSRSAAERDDGTARG